MVRSLGLAAVGLSVCLVSGAAAWPESNTDEAADFTTLVVQPLVSPSPVEATDGRTHLVYELSLVNQTSLHARVDSIVAFDPATGATLGEWKGDALSAILRLNGKLPGGVLGPGVSAYAFLDATAPRGAPIPKVVKHRIAVSRFEDDKGRIPLSPNTGLPAATSFEAAEVTVDPRKALAVEPPLRGRNWVAFNGCCDDLQHRGGVMAFNGVARIAERFAIDFMKLDDERRLFAGPRERNDSYATFGVPVYAVADGTVVEASDGAPERVPMKPEPTNIKTAVGNHVVLDLGGGNFALYAHLKTGTVSVKPGERLKAGEVIARAGDTGNSDMPHLHFHIMDGPAPLASNGIPYVFTSFVGAGRLIPDDRLSEAGGPAEIDASWRSGPHEAELPLDVEVVDFPEK